MQDVEFYIKTNMSRFLFFLVLISASLLQAQEVEKGWFGNVRAGYTTYVSVINSEFTPTSGNRDIDIDANTRSISLNLVSGYRFSPHFSAGIGIGLDGIREPDFNTMPLFVDLKLYSDSGSNSIYMYLNAGKHVDLGIENSSFRTGGLLAVGLGYQFNLFDMAFQADIGYHLKNLEINPPFNAGGSNRFDFKGININLAILVFQ